LKPKQVTFVKTDSIWTVEGMPYEAVVKLMYLKMMQCINLIREKLVDIMPPFQYEKPKIGLLMQQQRLFGQITK